MNIYWTTERREISKLIPADYNPRQMTEKQVKTLRKSLEKFSVADPIIVNQNGRIIGGHQRCKILADIGIKEVDVRIPDRQLTDEEEQELNLRLNQNKGEFDFDALANNFELDFLKEVGFDSKDIDKIIGKQDHSEDDEFNAEKAKDEIKEPKAKLGDIWALGPHRLLCGDSTDSEAVIGLFGQNKADMVFTDPPYGVSYVGKTKDALEIENDKLSDDGELKSFLEQALGNTVGVMKDGGVIYVAAPSRPINQTFAEVLKALDVWRQTIIWVKDSLVLSRSDYHYQHEPIFYGWKPNAKHNWYGDRKQTTIWNIDRPKRSAEHPTMKPIALIEKALVNSSKAGDIIFDPFGGSGSTLIGCENLGRTCYTIEIDPKYSDVIIKRWEEKTGLKAEKVI